MRYKIFLFFVAFLAILSASVIWVGQSTAVMGRAQTVLRNRGTGALFRHFPAAGAYSILFLSKLYGQRDGTLLLAQLYNIPC